MIQVLLNFEKIPNLIFRRRKVTFIDKEGQEHTFEVADGDNLLDVAQSEDIEMEGVLHPLRSPESSLRPIRSMRWLMRLFNMPRHRGTEQDVR